MGGLRGDERLRKKIPLDLKNPTNQEMLQALQKDAGLNLTLDQRLETEKPEFGRVKSSFNVWQVMELMAQKQIHGARWDKIEDGYRLTSAAPLGTRSTPWLLSPGVLGPIVIGLAVAVKRQGSDAGCALGHSLWMSMASASLLAWLGHAV